ncbi:MAG TPA: PAS domain S-box protein, partial [Clostridia bacterium]|nr:PAS domain S-box protein [Clostridia bacterium]
PGAERLFGYRASEMIGRHVSVLASPEDPTDIPGILQRVKQGEVVTRVAAERIRKDGRRVVISLAVCPVRSPEGRVIGITKIAHDITEHVQTQQTLQQSEENLRTIFNSDMDGIVLHRLDGVVLHANETWCRLFGVNLEQARQLSIADVSDSSMNMERARELWAKVVAGEPQFFEWKSRRVHDGVAFDTEIYLRRIRVNREDVILGHLRDVTQRKHSEEQMRLQSAALEAAANAIAILGRNGLIEWVNPAFTRLTGYSAEEVLGQNPRMLKSGVHPTSFYERMWETVLAGQVWHGEVVNRRKNGSLYPEEMTITPVKEATGAISHFIAIKQDITQRKNARQALLRQNQQLSVLNAAAEALLVDRDSQVALATIYERIADYFQVDGFVEFQLSQAGDALELVACKAVAEAKQPTISRLALGQGIAGKVAQTRQPIVVANAQHSAAPDLQFVKDLGAQAYACEPLVIGDRLLGTLSFASCRRQSFTASEQEFFRTLANYIALAKERLRLTLELQQHARNLEQTVLERTAQLVEANANLQTFTHTAAHDLRSPLRSIKSFSSIAIEECGPQLGSEGLQYLRRICESADRLSNLLNDLLEYSKLGQAELRMEPVALGKAVEEALALLQDEIRSKGAEVAVETPMPSVQGHPATVTLIITNFVSNALKFVPVGLQPQIRIRAGISAGFVRLEVEDNGIGITPEDQAKLFQPFQRLQSKSAYPGTGLGLAIVRRAVERMGGHVGIRSQQGQGSCFWTDLQPAP